MVLYSSSIATQRIK